MIKAIQKLNPLDSYKVENNDTKLPPLLSLFLNTYSTEPVLKNEKVYHHIKDYMYSIAWEIDFLMSPFLSNDGDTDFLIFNPEKINNRNDYPSEWKANKLLIIGGTHASQFYIGNGKNNIDQFFIDRDYEGKYKEVANNIYHFFSKLYLQKSQSFLKSIGLSENDLYKNWKEDFYRIK